MRILVCPPRALLTPWPRRVSTHLSRSYRLTFQIHA